MSFLVWGSFFLRPRAHMYTIGHDDDDEKGALGDHIVTSFGGQPNIGVDASVVVVVVVCCAHTGGRKNKQQQQQQRNVLAPSLPIQQYIHIYTRSVCVCGGYGVQEKKETTQQRGERRRRRNGGSFFFLLLL